MESSASIEIAKQALLTFGLILAIGSFLGITAKKLKTPDVAIFLLAGMVLGPEVMGVIDIKANSIANQLILIFGSCYILFDGGASLKLKVLKEVWLTVVILSTLGVLISMFVTGVVAYWILGIPFIIALLLGATIASTDPATLVPVFQQVKIRERVAQAVMSESAFNDAMGAIATFTVLGIAAGHAEFSLFGSMGELLWQACLGIFVGGILGYLAAVLIAHEKFSFLLEYAPLVTLMAVIGAYMGADGAHASGFMAVFTFGIILGNKDMFGFEMQEREAERMEDYITTTALIMRMFIFILLGSQVNFALMNEYLIGGVIVVLIFMFIGRPLTVFACAALDPKANWTRNELLFMCWTRETGVIPGALAGMLVGMKAPGADVVASVTFIAILMTILIQATTTKWVAKKLGMLETV
ncbi:sodium:proton antiporter [Thiothrix unzii]|jgi:cell volume regulation protein A|uniref:cation:proton antiporter n=1 Tax=Thiothrix unzii TaxID=111769 RepID=UPI002A368416|nr:sodium:proton antiporter [Thiothrix unzii]MDX9989700.1 sodium:proton antiporter [Thiothrix unzii]